MNNKLKKAFNEKMEIIPSKHFDTNFKKVLEKERLHKSFLSKWWGWFSLSAVSLVTFLFFFQQSHDLAYPHQQYVHSVIEMDEEADESITNEKDIVIDLTGFESDEI